MKSFLKRDDSQVSLNYLVYLHERNRCFTSESGAQCKECLESQIALHCRKEAFEGAEQVCTKGTM